MRNFLLFLALSLNFYPQTKAQTLKEIAERPWWGLGRFKTDLVMQGFLLISYELQELRMNEDNTLTGKLIEKLVLEERSYYKSSVVRGVANPENTSLDIQEHKVLSADALPDPFEWPAISMSLKAGYDPDRPSGFVMKGQAQWGTIKGETEFRDYPFTR